MVTQNGVPFMQPDELQARCKFQRLFVDWDVTRLHPTYAGGPMAFGWGPCHLRRVMCRLICYERLTAARLDLAYYTPDVHKAAFACRVTSRSFTVSL